MLTSKFVQEICDELQERLGVYGVTLTVHERAPDGSGGRSHYGCTFEVGVGRERVLTIMAFTLTAALNAVQAERLRLKEPKDVR